MTENKTTTKATAKASSKQTASKTIVLEALGKKMLEAGVHFGHKKSNWNPKMKPYIFGIRNNIYIIDLEKTMEELGKALEFIKTIVKNKGKILFIGTRPQDQLLVEEVAKKCEMPYIVSRWIGGLLTNFKNIRKRIEYLIELENGKASGGFKKYTKKEQLNIDKEIEKLKKKFEGVKKLEKLPDAVLVLSVKSQMTAIKEAKREKIPIIALVDTDSNPSLVEYPIPSNDEAVSVLKFMLTKIEETIHPIKSRKTETVKQ